MGIAIAIYQINVYESLVYLCLMLFAAKWLFVLNVWSVVSGHADSQFSLLGLVTDDDEQDVRYHLYSFNKLASTTTEYICNMFSMRERNYMANVAYVKHIYMHLVNSLVTCWIGDIHGSITMANAHYRASCHSVRIVAYWSYLLLCNVWSATHKACVAWLQVNHNAIDALAPDMPNIRTTNCSIKLKWPTKIV